MTKYYYTDPLKAAYMAREFGVRFWNGEHELHHLPFVDAEAEGRNIIHPDSEHIFSPIEWDCMLSDGGALFRFMSAPDGVKFKECSTIMRDNKHFFTPEAEHG